METGDGMRTVNLLCALATLAAAGPALAASNEATFSVTAAVVARVVMTTEYQAPTLTITQADVDRGYVEIPGASRITVRCNSLSGYLLSFAGEADYYSQVVVSGLRTPALVSGQGGWLQQPYSRDASVMQLSYRFVLSQTARPGVYPWPLALSATLL